MEPSQFITTFHTFLIELNKVVTQEYKYHVYQLFVMSKIKEAEETLKFFYSQCYPYQSDILSENDRFIEHLKPEFEFLDAYYSLDQDSKSNVLKYIQQLYILAALEMTKLNLHYNQRVI